MLDSTNIRILPDNIISLIASGQVVHRPSSALKELLENALDAEATNIKVLFEDGGKTLLQVIDDGHGMSEADVDMCIQRHATSKIYTQDDLGHIASYGFRGEAMNAIAAVAEVEILTRVPEDELGTCLVIEESKVKKKEAVATSVGTQVSVRYLFRNVPARRNFLKSNAVESRHVIDVFQYMTLARPDVAFSLYQNNNELYHLPRAKLSRRIVHLFGKQYEQQLIPCEEKAGEIYLKGYIGTPSQAKKTRGGQFFFVNTRYIKSPYLHHAVKKAFEQLISVDSFPFYTLFISVPLDHIDINVHPNKTEVKFTEEKLLYALISTCLRKALAQHHCMHTIDFAQNDTKVLFTPLTSPAPTQPVDLSAHEPEGEKPLMLPLMTLSMTSDAVPVASIPPPVMATTTMVADQVRSLNVPAKLQLHKKYIVTQVKSGLLVINQRKAYERILYERNMRMLRGETGHSQKLLFPYQVVLQPADLMLFKSFQEILRRLGFRFSLQENGLLVQGQPINIFHAGMPGAHVITELLAQYTKCSEPSISAQEKWAKALARRNNLPVYATLQPSEMESIVDQLFACKNPNYTIDGEVVWHIVPIEKLEALLV